MTDRVGESGGEIIKVVRHDQVKIGNENEKSDRTAADKLTPRTTSDIEPTNDIMQENSSPPRELILLGQAEQQQQQQQLREVTDKAEQPTIESSQKQQDIKSPQNEKNTTPTSGDSSPANTTIITNETNNSCNINSSNNIDSERRYRPQKYCAVCGDKAIACNFNAVTCESCKAFFRRNAFKETRLKCLFENRCVIDRVTRRFCSKCRLLKCFQIGMKREWILTDEQKQIKRVKIMQNKQSRLQKSSTSPGHSEESVSPKLTTTVAPTSTVANNLRVASPVVVTNELTTDINTIDANQSPTRSYNNNNNNNNNSEDPYSSTNYITRSQAFDSNEKTVKISTRSTKVKQMRTSPVVVETRDASTSCPDEFSLSSPHSRVMQHCSFASQCQYCSLRLFGSSTPSTLTTGGQQVFVDYHHQQHVHQQLEQHHQHLQQPQQHHPHPHPHLQQQQHQQQQQQLHPQQLEPQQWQQHQHQINDSSSASHRIVPAYVAQLPSSDQLEHHSIQGSHQAASDHQDIAIHAITGSAPVAVTSCCNCHMGLNNLNPVASQFSNHHHDNNGHTNQPPISGDCDQTTATVTATTTTITTNNQISPQLHLMTPSHNTSSTSASGGNGSASNGIGSSDSNLINWNNEFYCPPACTEAELRLRLEKMDFLDTEKQVVLETIEATRFIFESNENHKHICDFHNDIVIFCDAALRRLIQTVKQIKAFQMLNMDDQIVLLKTACFKILLLRSTYHYNDEFEGWIDHKTGNVMTLDILKRAKKSLVYERHKELVKKMPEPLRRDRFIMSIMAMTLLFDPTTNLKHSNSVALDNLIYLNVLRRYLISTQPDPLNKYETLVTILQIVKACNDEYIVFFSKDFQKNQITPLLIEIFDIPN